MTFLIIMIIMIINVIMMVLMIIIIIIIWHMEAEALPTHTPEGRLEPHMNPWARHFVDDLDALARVSEQASVVMGVC